MANTLSQTSLDSCLRTALKAVRLPQALYEWLSWLSVPLLLFAIFALAVWTPEGLVVPVYYVAGLILVIALPGRRERLLAAVTCTLLMIVDYFFLRRRELIVEDLYRRGGAYEYTRGVNWIAMLALALGIAPNLPGFLGAIGVIKASPLASGIYNWAWFVGLGVASIVYLFVMRLSVRTSGAPAHASR